MESIRRKLSLAALMCCGALVALPAGAMAQGADAKDGCRDGVRTGDDGVFDNTVRSCGNRGRNSGRNNRDCFRFDSRNRRDNCRDRGSNRRHNGNRNNRFDRRNNGNRNNRFDRRNRGNRNNGRRCDNFDRRGRRRQCRNNNGRSCGKFDHRNRRENCRTGEGRTRADADVSRIDGNRVRA